MAEKSAVKTFSTKTVYYDVDKDDDGKVISKTQTGVSPNVAIEMPAWMLSVEAFDVKFKSLPDFKAIRDDIFAAGIKVKVQSHLRNTVATTLAKIGDWTVAKLVVARDSFKPSMGREKIDQIEKSRRELSKLFNREVTRDEVLAIQKKNVKA